MKTTDYTCILPCITSFLFTVEHREKHALKGVHLETLPISNIFIIHYCKTVASVTKLIKLIILIPVRVLFVIWYIY